jgi:hypothetical protein
MAPSRMRGAELELATPRRLSRGRPFAVKLAIDLQNERCSHCNPGDLLIQGNSMTS